MQARTNQLVDDKRKDILLLGNKLAAKSLDDKEFTILNEKYKRGGHAEKVDNGDEEALLRIHALPHILLMANLFQCLM